MVALPDEERIAIKRLLAAIINQAIFDYERKPVNVRRFWVKTHPDDWHKYDKPHARVRVIGVPYATNTYRHLRAFWDARGRSQRVEEARASARAFLFARARESAFGVICYGLGYNPDYVRDKIRKRHLDGVQPARKACFWQFSE